MKAVRIIVGVLASLFVVAHLLEFPAFLSKLNIVPDHLIVSVWAGKIASLLIGTAIAIACLKKRKPKEEAGPSQHAAPPELPKAAPPASK